MATNDRYVSAGADIKFKRSRMPLNRRAMFSYFHGYLHPLGDPIEVLPGDTFKVDLSMFVRMSTPIVPFADNIRAEADFFFVPKRILWNKTKQFYGESESFGVATKVQEPTLVSGNNTHLNGDVSSLTTNLLKSESFAAAFGLVSDGTVVGNGTAINLLPLWSILAIYNEYYRDENYQNQYKWNKDVSGVYPGTSFATRGTGTIDGLSLVPQVNKDRDLFTSILPYQIKGNPIFLSIGTTAPIKAIDSTGTAITGLDINFNHLHDSGSPTMTLNAKFGTSNNVSAGLADNWQQVNITNVPSSTNRVSGDLYADLAQATGVNLSDLIYSLCYQDFLSRCAKFGTRYKEYIYSMFGTTIADASEDIPEYLGRMKFAINVQQVVQTTGFDPSSISELGQVGAYSKSGSTGKVFTKSFTEPGYLVPVFYTKHQRTYSSGIDPVFLKHNLLDYYQPPFANIQDVPVLSRVLYSISGDSSDDSSIGFQEPWWEYRSLQDRTFGMMNPKIDTLGQLWTLADLYSSRPTINAAFMVEDRAAIARVLTTGQNGPDFIVDSMLYIDATRVMPLYPSSKLGVF